MGHKFSNIFLIFFIPLIALCKSQPKPKYDDYPKKEEWYPKYHLAPPSGWMNDPNGLISFDGYYHAFYQHNPFDPFPVGDKIGWGHARSKNMLQWEHLPMALSPSIYVDKNGCFSGSAVIDNEIMTLIYTGRYTEADVYHQVQCIAASKDTINFDKHGKVLGPPNGNLDFRDPKVWREGNLWYMVVGTREDDTGEVLLYRSPNLRQWEYQGVLARADKSLGYMWECPDFFPLDDKYVLVVSPQGIEAEGYKYRNLYQSGYFVGNWRPGHKFNIQQNFTELDNGHDFYAPQSFLAPDGRRILIGWMDMWDAPIPEDKQNWAGMFTLPRELSLTRSNSVRILPIREVETLRNNPVHISTQVLNNKHMRLHNHVTAMEIIMTWNLTASYAEKYGLRLGDGNYGAGGVYVYVDDQSRRLVLDRRYPKYNISGYRSISLVNLELLHLRVFLDHSSIEVFVNNGLACMSSRIYPSKSQRALSIFAENGSAALKTISRWLLG